MVYPVFPVARNGLEEKWHFFYMKYARDIIKISQVR